MNPIRRIYTFFHKNLLTKTMAIGVVLALMGTTCLIQLANIQLVNGKGMAQAAAQSRTTTVTLKARRGKIMDTNGAILAQSVERYTIIGNPEQAQAFIPTTCTKQTGSNCHQINGKPVGVTGAAAVARLLAPVLGMDATELGAKLSIRGQYVVLKKDVTPAVKRKISKLNLGGIVYAELSNERLYSNGTLMGSLLGGVDADGKGVAGIEQMENKTLTGRDGYQVYQQGNSGVEIPGTMTESKDAVNGSDVTLTIDRDVQWYTEKVLSDSENKYHSAWGIAMVQDVQSGDILALADSDTTEAGSDQAKMGASRAVSETFEPGSIGKVLAMSGMPQFLVESMAQAGLGATAFLMLYVLIVIALGMVVDSSSILLIVLPLMLPLAEQFGMNLVWFGVVTVVAVEIGLLTPPFGLSVYVIKSTLQDESISLGDIFRGTAPFTLMMLGVLLLLIFFPAISLVLLR